MNNEVKNIQIFMDLRILAFIAILVLLALFWLIFRLKRKEVQKNMSKNDDQLKQNVIDQLYWDNRINSDNIKVEVKDKKVILSGHVDTFWNKRIAENDVMAIPGTVEINNLLVVKHPLGVMVPKDDKIKTNVEAVISWDPNLETSKIDVSIKDGVITLEGTVDSFWKKFEAERIVGNVRGVLGVTNKLSIVRVEDIVDETIAKNIEDALARNLEKPELNSIDIEVGGGKVILSGTAKNWITYEIAYNAALYTAGVVDVKNEMSILN